LEKIDWRFNQSNLQSNGPIHHRGKNEHKQLNQFHTHPHNQIKPIERTCERNEKEAGIERWKAEATQQKEPLEEQKRTEEKKRATLSGRG
jgi:hypothetical protein